MKTSFSFSWRKLFSIYVKIAVFFKVDIGVFIAAFIELFQQF